MTRTLRILKSTTDNATITAAPPLELVALELDFVVILATLLCTLICVVGPVAVARCSWLWRGSSERGNPRFAMVCWKPGCHCTMGSRWSMLEEPRSALSSIGRRKRGWPGGSMVHQYYVVYAYSS